MLSLRRRFSSYSVCLFGAVVLTGCSFFGGQTGEGEEAPPECVSQSPVLIGLNDPSTLGFSAQDILAFSADTELDASWLASAKEAADAAPVEASLRLTLEPLAKEARYIKSVGSADAADADERCPDWLEVDVRADVALHNADGDVSFAFESALKAKTAFLAELSERVRYSAEAQSLQFAPESAEESVVGLSVLALLSPLGSSGAVEVITESTFVPEGYDPDARPSSDEPQARPYQREATYPLAYFPLENECGGWNDGRYTPKVHVEPVAVGLPLSLVEMAEQLSFETEMRWDDGSVSTLTAEATVGDTAACLQASCEFCGFYDFYESPTHLALPLLVLLTSSDGRLAGEYSETAQIALGSDGDVQALSFQVIVRDIPVAEVEEATGLSQAPVDGEQVANFYLRLEISPDEAGTTGQLHLSSPRPPVPCTNSDEPCTNSPEGDDEGLRSATW